MNNSRAKQWTVWRIRRFRRHERIRLALGVEKKSITIYESRRLNDNFFYFYNYYLIKFYAFFIILEFIVDDENYTSDYRII